MSIATYEQALDVVRKLTPDEQQRLVQEIHALLLAPVTPTNNNDAWERLNQLRKELAALPRGAGTLAEQLERDRSEREASLIGRRPTDVHA